MDNIQTIRTIFEAFDGVPALASAVAVPMQTAWDWNKKANIPPWRRPSILTAAKRLRLELPEEAIAYLKSNERPARRARIAA